ncbi:Uma2 family endonuclease [Ilyomonas limi]|uniref:Uma2 family endonuclease n=1 Tax=Ilyomonas limi TaxID=2575867 RepID=A0A4U3L969_9BACT|nr:Uma2 family endonuclease [Ilyomonas limi]TKK71925.1 Uma2 family endonuclease [Ilyomonas limi]
MKRLLIFIMGEPVLKCHTAAEYLAFEKTSQTKHEFYKGEIFDTDGASFKHNQIQTNFVGEVRAFLKGRPCDVFGSDLRIHIPSNTLYTYPDAIIICGKPQLPDDEFDTVLNPSVIA